MRVTIKMIWLPVSIWLVGSSCTRDGQASPPAPTRTEAAPSNGPGSPGIPGTPGIEDTADQAPPCPNDGREPNDEAGTATMFGYETISDNGYAYGTIDAHLCNGDQDWYLVPTRFLGYTLNLVKVRVLARNAGWCGASCGELELLPALENTIMIELYDRTGTILMTGNVGDSGITAVQVEGSPVGNDFLLRIAGPVGAEYSYRLEIDIQDFEGEDECEC